MTMPYPQNDTKSSDPSPTEELVQTALGDWVFPSLNGLIFSKHRAQDVLQAHFGDRLHQQDRLYVIVGSDSGQLIEYVRTHAELPRGARWIFIEPDDICERLRGQPEIAANLDEYVHLVTLEEWPEQARLLQLDAYFRIGGVVFEQSLAALDSRHPQYDELNAKLDAELTQLRFKVTTSLTHAPFIATQLINTPNFPTSVEALAQAFAGKTAMILAGGPSLDEMIPWIRAHRSGLFLIAVSRISGRLQEAGIEPDILVTVDPKPISLTVSRQMFEFGPQTLLVTSNHPYPAIVNRWPHALAHMDALLPWTDDLNPKNNLASSGPTVTHAATVLAEYLGFDTIIFAGLDLCHAPNGQTHAQGSSEAAAGPLLDYTALSVKTNSGATAYTTPDYFAGIETMAAIARSLKEKGIRCVNPSVNAARIDNIEFVPAVKLSPPEKPFDRSALDAVISDQIGRNHRAFLDQLSQRLEQMLEDLAKIQHLTQLAMESNQAYFHTLNPERQQLHRRRMRAVDRFMRLKLIAAESLVKNLAASVLISTDLPHDFFDLSPKQAEQLSHRFYKALHTESQRIRPQIEQILFRIETRRLENACESSTDIRQLVDRYMEGSEPERGLWLSRHQGATRTDIEPAESSYGQHLAELIEKDQQRKREKRAPQASLRLAEIHFSQNNTAALSSMSQTLRQHPERDRARPYGAYVDGLLNELEGEPNKALLHYEEVLNQADQQQDLRLLEHCLLRVAAVSLTTDPAQVDQASQALETASQINPAHWPHLANLAVTLDQPQNAINALSHYLQHFPGDSLRVEQLADIFASQGVMEGVIACRELLPFCAPAHQQKLEMHLAQLLGSHEAQT